jgi:hypothetical protein
VDCVDAELAGLVVPNSALNLLVLRVSKDGPAEILVKNYYRKEEGKADRTLYYKLFRQRMAGGGTAVFSSTLRFLPGDHGFAGEELGTDRLASLDASPQTVQDPTPA